MRYFLIILTIQFLTIQLFSENESKKITNNEKQDLTNKIVGTWINISVLELIKSKKSLINTYQNHDVETEGYAMLSLEFNNDTLMRMLSSFHDSGFDMMVNTGDTLYNNFHKKTDFLYFTINNKITWHYNGHKWVYSKISNNYDNIDSVLNYFFLDILFNNKTFYDSTNSKYLFLNGKIIIDGIKTLKYSIEKDPLMLFEYESDLLYIGENNELYRFQMTEDKLILRSQEKEMILIIKK